MRIKVIVIVFVFIYSIPWAHAAEDAENPTLTNETENTDVSTDSDGTTTNDADTDSTDQDAGQKICSCRYTDETPYRDRRDDFSGFFGFQAGNYVPHNYQPDFVTQSFDSYFPSSPNPSLDVVFGFTWNFLLGSLGLQLSGGYFSVTATSTANGNDTLSVYPITAGVIYSMDTIFPEPYVVPYGVAGVYSAVFNEAAGGLTFSGRTALAPFFAYGLMFQLDWMDLGTHDAAYEDFGLENTFLYVEGRTYVASADSGDPDLSTPVEVNAGLRFEF